VIKLRFSQKQDLILIHPGLSKLLFHGEQLFVALENRCWRWGKRMPGVHAAVNNSVHIILFTRAGFLVAS